MKHEVIPWIPAMVSEHGVTVRGTVTVAYSSIQYKRMLGCWGCFGRRVIEVLEEYRWSFAEKEAWAQEGRWGFAEKEAWVQEGRRSFVQMKPCSNPSRLSSAKAVPVLGHHSGRRRRRQFSRCRSLLRLLSVARSLVASMSSK
jgi:hypothetical protein